MHPAGCVGISYFSSRWWLMLWRCLWFCTSFPLKKCFQKIIVKGIWIIARFIAIVLVCRWLKNKMPYQIYTQFSQLSKSVMKTHVWIMKTVCFFQRSCSMFFLVCITWFETRSWETASLHQVAVGSHLQLPDFHSRLLQCYVFTLVASTFFFSFEPKRVGPTWILKMST